MCGILGCLPKPDPALFDSALASLEHRGPDDVGTWSDGSLLSLGHRRLSILDLTDSGRQPMSTPDGRYTIVYNGEIYNFLELRKELEGHGHSFSSGSDTEVILSAWSRWGADCLLRFNGMWAFAIWDSRNRELVLARDRLGKKPLFYTDPAAAGGRFAFASEMKALYPFLDSVAPSKDFPWMAAHMMEYESTDRCLVKGIRRFPAGHWAVFRDGGVSLTRYWNTLDHLEEVPAGYGEQVERFRELFEDACRIRMRSDVPIGTALSGGLDSSAVISTMAHIARQGAGERRSPDWQHAFVAAFPGTPLDESSFARRVVDNVGIEATFLDIDPVSYVDDLDHHLYMFEELYLTSPIPMLATYRSIRDRGVTVSIDGHGADELFSGYGDGLLEALPSAGLNLSAAAHIVATHRQTVIQDSAQFADHRSAAWLWAKTMGRKVLEPLRRKDYRSRDREHPAYRSLDSLNRYLYILTHETVLPTLLRNYDRYSMASGVEIRMPFLDHRLLTFCMSLPQSSKIRGGYTKAVVRDAVGDLMPPEVTRRKTKVGFNSPVVDWMQGPMREYFLDSINSVDFSQCDLIDPVSVRQLVERAVFGEEVLFSEAEAAFKAMTPFLWQRALDLYAPGGRA
jgi:asparagine synthase (glutamine-hydrolysing)